MSYTKSQMVYDDYKWTAKTGHDNPQIIGGQERSELNRSEGYEMLYFINSLAKTWGWTLPYTDSARRLEQIIRNKVPSSTRTHSGIKEWIQLRYEKI